MMTKDEGITSSTASLVTMPSGATAVLVTLPTSMGMTTANVRGHNIILQATAVKDEVDDDFVESLNAAGMTLTSPISNVRASHATLQSLLAAPITAARVIPPQEQTIQVITLPASELITTSHPDGAGRVWQVIPGLGHPDVATIIAVADPSELLQASKHEMSDGIELDLHDASGELSITNADAMAAILMPPPPPVDCPPWAARLQCCEKIGESYRGYVESEGELDLLLTYHKQQTSSFWGTRQSPSPAKPSTRLMWKSQYVPFDGIPFVNIGSRAVVMECQYGPRRKGNASKRSSDGTQVRYPQANQYRQTCPARIYIKRVRKYPEYAVDLRQDKKSLRVAMDKAFHDLREQRLESFGVERLYVQLPTLKAHEFHDDMGQMPAIEKKEQLMLDLDSEVNTVMGDKEPEGVRLHPKVINKIRSFVAGGETRVYAIRKQLRSYVLREMFAALDRRPERHDLTLFPTVNDLKNNIHQAIRDIENGTLGVTAPTINVEILPTENSEEEFDKMTSLTEKNILRSSMALPETVTVTLTSPGADGHHIISRIETHLSDGTTQISDTLTPETAQILSRLHPTIFPMESLMQLGVSSSAEELAGTAHDLGEGIIVSVPEGHAVLAAGDNSDSAPDDDPGEEMQVVSPEDECSDLLQQTDDDQSTQHLAMAVSVDVELTEEDGTRESVLVNDSDIITIATIAMSDDNQLVLPGQTETYEPQ